LKAAILYGFWEFGIGMTLLYWSERVVPSGLAAAVYALCPLAAIFEARALGMEVLSPRKLLGAGSALVGIIVIFWSDIRSGGSLAGLCSVTLAALAAPLAALMLQRGPKQDAVGANAVGALVGLPIALVLSFVIGESHPVPSSVSQILPVAYLA